MKNEIQLLDNVSVKIQPGAMELTDKANLLKMADEINAKYDKQIVTEDTIKADKKLKRQIGRIIKALEDERIKQHKIYEEPYNQFKNDVKEVTSALQQTVDPLTSQIKKIEEQQREQRRSKVQELINKMAPQYDIDPTTIEIEDSWTNASMTEMKLTQILADGFKARKKADEQNKKIRQMSIQLIKRKCEALRISASPWICMLTMGTELDDVLKAIDKSIEDRQKKAKKEEARIALQSLVNRHVGDKLVDENGEIISQEPTRKTVQIEVTATNDELADLYDYMNLKKLDYSVKDIETVEDN